MTHMRLTCYKCCLFDEAKKSGFKCGVPGSCPGRDWPEDARKYIAEMRKERERLQRIVSKRDNSKKVLKQVRELLDSAEEANEQIKQLKAVLERVN